MLLLVYLTVFLSLTGHSTAIYCLCKDGVSEQMLQKTLDYACGAGADCSPITQNAPCFNPDTVKDHCNYAVNSYFQKKGQAIGTCDFSGTAAVASNPPLNLPPSCTFPSIGSTPTTGTPTTLTTGTPSITPTMGTPTTGIPSTTSTTGNPVFSDGTTPLGPSVTTTGFGDLNHAVSPFGSTTATTNILFTFAITLWRLLLDLKRWF
ncbi:hypothetical protein HRI_004625500 [Hibiscus trionum]|uniref:X8 domain-containing protein n=1 Tax=Hibiscus trionum TaxID=183268 RepID=A0A9W7MLP4_HIBTR|nr:hypothetical protein HRI_004625500 [Hibiscus trionum]